MANNKGEPKVQCWCWLCLGRSIEQAAWLRHQGITRSSINRHCVSRWKREEKQE